MCQAVTAMLCDSFINPGAAIWLILEFLTFNVVLMLLFFAQCQSVTGSEQRTVNHGGQRSLGSSAIIKDQTLPAGEGPFCVYMHVNTHRQWHESSIHMLERSRSPYRNEAVDSVVFLVHHYMLHALACKSFENMAFKYVVFLFCFGFFYALNIFIYFP